MKIAIMQPCYLPWRGYFALMRNCDGFVHLDDVALPHGRSYITRTAVRTTSGRAWLSVPVERREGERIADASIAGDHWRRKHLRTLEQELPGATPIVADLYERPWTHLAALDIALAECVARALGVARPTSLASALSISERTTGSARILAICTRVGATRYLTGHGGARYLDHEAFERAGVEVLYLDYDLSPYAQPPAGMPFDPYVTALDLLEHTADPLAHVEAKLVPWRQFVREHAGHEVAIESGPAGPRAR